MWTNKDLVPFVNDVRKNVIGFDHLWDDLVHRSLPGFDNTFPKDNVIQLENTVIIELALAGYEKENITVGLESGCLIVSADKEDREELEDAVYVRKNIATRAFTKSYTISADYKDIRARFKNGILSINLEKEVEEDNSQVIEIS